MFSGMVAEYCELQRMRAEIKADIAKFQFELNALKHEIGMVARRINQVKKDIPCKTEPISDELRKTLIREGWVPPKKERFKCPRMDIKYL